MGHWRPALRAVALAAIVMANTADASVGMDITNGGDVPEPQQVTNPPFQSRTLLQGRALIRKPGTVGQQEGATNYYPRGAVGAADYGSQPNIYPQGAAGAANYGDRPAYSSQTQGYTSQPAGYGTAQRNHPSGAYNPASGGHSAAAGAYNTAQRGYPTATGVYNPAGRARNPAGGYPSAGGRQPDSGTPPHSNRRPALIDRIQQRVKEFQPSTRVGEVMRSMAQTVADGVVEFFNGL